VVPIRTRQIQDGGRPPFWKKPLNRHISAMTDFDEIWHGDANWPPTGDRRLEFRIFQKPRWRRPPSWKATKIAIWQQRIDRSSQNLAWLYKMGLLTAQIVKNLNFQNPRWWTAAILTRSSAIAEGPRDASCQWNLANCHATVQNYLYDMKLKI